MAIVEIGGTVGDIESLPFLEAVRQLKLELGPTNALSIHVTLVPWIGAAGELKTKPTQHSVKELREIGIQPDILICRTEKPLSRAIKEKISLFSNVPPEMVISAPDVTCIYALPETLHEQGIDELLCEKLNIWSRLPDIGPWKRVVERFLRPSKGTARIAVVGKYVHLRDSYKSLHEALVHGGIFNDVRVDLHYVDSEASRRATTSVGKILGDVDAILVPGGFGERGTEGKIAAIRYARERASPSSASASGCSSRWSSSRATSRASRGPTAPSSTPRPPP